MKKPFFVHVPKTGGHFISHSLNIRFDHIYFNKPHPNNLVQGWVYHNLTRDALGEDYFSFAFVRNPFDFLVSWYHYITQNRLWEVQSLPHLPFPDFLRMLSEDAEIYPGRRFLFFQLFGSDGKLIVDCIGRMENFQTDFEKITSKYGYQVLDVQEGNRNISEHEHYSHYYDNALVSLVNKLYGREMKVFGYSFDGHSIPMISLPWMNRGERLKFSYDHQNDVLMYDNQVILR